MTGFLLSGELEPTPAYAHREFAWVPTVVGEGVLTIRLRRTEGSAEEADVYAVRRQVPPEEGVSEFLLLNVTDPEQPDIYKVQFGPRGNTCNCKAGRCGLECKHRDAVQQILTPED